MSTQDTTPTTEAVITAATQLEALPDSRLTLIGIIESPQGARALIRRGRSIKHIEPGDRIAGQTVTVIGMGQVLLVRNGETTALRLPGQ